MVTRVGKAFEIGAAAGTDDVRAIRVIVETRLRFCGGQVPGPLTCLGLFEEVLGFDCYLPVGFLEDEAFRGNRFADGLMLGLA